MRDRKHDSSGSRILGQADTCERLRTCSEFEACLAPDITTSNTVRKRELQEAAGRTPKRQDGIARKGPLRKIEAGQGNLLVCLFSGDHRGRHRSDHRRCYASLLRHHHRGSHRSCCHGNYRHSNAEPSRNATRRYCAAPSIHGCHRRNSGGWSYTKAPSTNARCCKTPEAGSRNSATQLPCQHWADDPSGSFPPLCWKDDSRCQNPAEHGQNRSRCLARSKSVRHLSCPCDLPAPKAGGSRLALRCAPRSLRNWSERSAMPPDARHHSWCEPARAMPQRPARCAP